MPSERQREAARILRLAQRDLKAARAMLDVDAFEEPTWGYHIQQSTEKALKAWISALEQPYPRTHDLALLCRLVSDYGGDPSPYASLGSFTGFGSRLRYEEDEEPLNLDRATWNQLCTDLLAHVASLLP